MLSTKMLFFKLALSYKMYYLAIFIPSSVCHYSTTAQHRYHQWWHGRGENMKKRRKKERCECRKIHLIVACPNHIFPSKKRERNTADTARKRGCGGGGKRGKEEEIILTFWGKISIYLCCFACETQRNFLCFCVFVCLKRVKSEADGKRQFS